MSNVINTAKLLSAIEYQRGSELNMPAEVMTDPQKMGEMMKRLEKPLTLKDLGVVGKNFKTREAENQFIRAQLYQKITATLEPYKTAPKLKDRIELFRNQVIAALYGGKKVPKSAQKLGYGDLPEAKGMSNKSIKRWEVRNLYDDMQGLLRSLKKPAEKKDRTLQKATAPKTAPKTAAKSMPKSKPLSDRQIKTVEFDWDVYHKPGRFHLKRLNMGTIFEENEQAIRKLEKSITEALNPKKERTAKENEKLRKRLLGEVCDCFGGILPDVLDEKGEFVSKAEWHFPRLERLGDEYDKKLKAAQEKNDTKKVAKLEKAKAEAKAEINQRNDIRMAIYKNYSEIGKLLEGKPVSPNGKGANLEKPFTEDVAKSLVRNLRDALQMLAEIEHTMKRANGEKVDRFQKEEPINAKGK